MSISVSCPSCDHAFKARDEYGGKRVKCPKCGEALSVPEAEPASAVDSDKPLRPPVRRAPSSAGSAVAAATAAVTPEPVFPSPAPLVTVMGATGTVAAARPGHARSARAAPMWVWIALACTVTGLVVGAGVFAAVRLSGGGRETATAKGKPSSDPGGPSKKGGKAGAKGPAEKDDGSIGITIHVDEHGNVQRPPVTVAKTVKQVLDGVVKIEVPLGGSGMSLGAGFFIDQRGWVATNHHVIANANSATRVLLADGTQCKVAGILADEPSQDLAILKLEDPPVKLTVLDISFRGDPELAEEVRACGHPHNLSFTFVNGTVGRLATSLELLKERPNEVLSKMKAPLDMVWIQHDVKIAQGNSGGPLINKNGQVVGVNSFVNELFGYASHVQYLRALTALCQDDQVKPLPEFNPAAKPPSPQPPPKPKPEPKPGPEPESKPEPQPVPKPAPPANALSPEGLRQLFDACAAFKWKPETPEHYDALAEFARAMTMVKHFHLRPDAGGAPKEAVAACAEAADKLFTEMKGAGWTAEHFAAINKLAADRLGQSGRGAVFYGSVAINSDTLQGAAGVIVMQPDGIDKKVVVKVGDEVARSPVGSKWLVLALVAGTGELRDNQGNSQPCSMLETHFMFKVE